MLSICFTIQQLIKYLFLYHYTIIIRNRWYTLGFEHTTLWLSVRCYTPKLQARMRCEWTYTYYVWVQCDTTIYINIRLSVKIWLSSIGTIHENIIFGIFSRKIIFELNPGSNPRPLDHEADTQPTELFGQVCNSCDPNSQQVHQT